MYCQVENEMSDTSDLKGGWSSMRNFLPALKEAAGELRVMDSVVIIDITAYLLKDCVYW